MSLSRRNPKRDGNEPAIVAALEAAGCQVWRLSGAGLPDLLVLSPAGEWQPLELKNPAGKNRLTPRQREARAPWPIIRTPEEALELLKPLKSASAGPKRVQVASGNAPGTSQKPQNRASGEISTAPLPR